MAGNTNVCEHGHLERRCDSCALIKAEAEIEKLRAVVKNLIECVKESPMGMMVLTDKKGAWNPDFHIEITLTVADVMQATDAIKEAQ